MTEKEPNIVELALRIIEKEAHRLRQELKKGKKPEWKDVRGILKALGALAEDKEIQAEAEKKSKWYVFGLNTFAAFTRSL